LTNSAKFSEKTVTVVRFPQKIVETKMFTIPAKTKFRDFSRQYGRNFAKFKWKKQYVSTLVLMKPKCALLADT